MKTKITKKDFNKANKVVEKYNQQINKQFIKPLKCICCKQNEIKPLKGWALANGFVSPSLQDTGSWDGGTVSKISFGFGSKFDMDKFFVAICDSCIKELIKSNMVIIINELNNKVKNNY